MTKVEFIETKGIKQVYKISNGFDEETKGFLHPLSKLQIQNWIKEFTSRRYYKGKYLIIAYDTSDEFEFIVGVWNNIREMAKETGINRNSIASQVARIGKTQTNIKIFGFKCKLELVDITLGD